MCAFWAPLFILDNYYLSSNFVRTPRVLSPSGRGVFAITCFSNVQGTVFLFPLLARYSRSFGRGVLDFSRAQGFFLFFCLVPLSYNWVLHSPRCPAPQGNRPSDQRDLYPGQVGAATVAQQQREYRVLQVARGRERPRRLRGTDNQAQRHEIRVGRAEKVDRVQDVDRGRDQRRWRPAELPYTCQNPRRRYVWTPVCRAFLSVWVEGEHGSVGGTSGCDSEFWGYVFL